MQITTKSMMASKLLDWQVIQRRQDGSVNFFRNWTEYAQGFGVRNGEFWLGNENIHLLTSSKRYRLRVDLTDWEGNSTYAEYDNFTVNDASDKYKLISLGKYSGTAGDAMSSLSAGNLGKNFSTSDKDNDEEPIRNCASNVRGGWWFNRCGIAFLNTPYKNGAATILHGKK